MIRVHASDLLIVPDISEAYYLFNDQKQEFQFKNVNILDPLNCTNNIGRSVSVISCHRLTNCMNATFKTLMTFATDADEPQLKLLFKNSIKYIQSLKIREKTIMRNPQNEESNMN